MARNSVLRQKRLDAFQQVCAKIVNIKNPTSFYSDAALHTVLTLPTDVITDILL